MRNHKVMALVNFNDLEDKTKRNIGDVFKCTEERCKVLIEHNAVELLEVEIEEEKLEEILEEDKDNLSNEEIKELKEDEIIDVKVVSKKNNKKRNK